MDELNEDQVSMETIDTEVPANQNIEIPHPVEGVEPSAASKRKSRPDKPIRPFPQFSIQEAMEIPKVIGAQNAGNPWAVEHIASALNTAKGTMKFFYLTSASRDYGFTTGTSKAKSIELTAQGRKLVFPATEDDETQAMVSESKS